MRYWDSYSLGAVAYEMLTGEPPHFGTSAQAIIAKLLTDDPRPVSSLRRTVPTHVEDATMCAFEKLPPDPFASASAFADALTTPAGRGTAVHGVRSRATSASSRDGWSRRAGRIVKKLRGAEYRLTSPTRKSAGRPSRSRSTLVLGRAILRQAAPVHLALDGTQPLMIMSEARTDRDLLELYNEKARELFDSTFVQQVRHPDAGSFTLSGAPFRAVRKAPPSNDAVKAFVLTFRFFYHDRDGMSFHKMASLYARLPVSAELKSEVVQIRKEVCRFLDGLTPFVIDDVAIGRRDLFDTWLFGRLAHVDPKKRSRLKEWCIENDVAPLYEHEFEHILMRLLEAIAWQRARNIAALEELAAAEYAARAI